MIGNAVVLNFSGGETSPRSRGRLDQPWYQTSAEKILNFIVELQGPARFRPGFVYARQTRQGQIARLVDFQVSDILSYVLEFTPGYMRVYNPLTQDLLLSETQTITGITNASPAVVTVASIGGIDNGDEVILDGIVGMPQLNGRQFLVAGVSGNTFQLTDPVTGTAVNTSSLPVYVSGGTAGNIYEIATSYFAAALKSLQWASDGSSGVLYLTSPLLAAQKLTVGLNNTFTLGTYSRTNDPFASGASLTLTGVTLGTITKVTFTGSPFYPGAPYTFSGVSGTTQLNGNTYLLVFRNGYGPHPYYAITDLNGNDINSSSWTAWSSGGTLTPGNENPIAVAFYEGRLVFAGTNQRPDCLFLSRSPDNNGNSRYDDFTGGTAADFACFFQLAPTGGSVSYISWIRGGPDYLFCGTFGGPFRISGSGLDIPITPSSINVRQFDTAGCEEAMSVGLAQMFFVQRSGRTLRSIKVINPYLATFESADMCLNAEQIGYSPIQRVVLQRGRPDALWTFSANGDLAGMSVHITSQNADTLTGWHRHQLGGNGAVQDLVVVPRQTDYDQLWAVVQRTINGVQRCYVEIMADDVIFPDKEDFYSGPSNETADLQAWENAVWRLQEDYAHLDAEAVYDGSLRGVNASATLAPSAVGVPQVEGAAAIPVTLTASANVFLASDVGSEIWVKPDKVTGLGAGRALITSYISTTQVLAVVSVPFSSIAAIAAGDWYFAVSTFYGFGHLEGQTVAAVGDGAVISDGGQTDDSDFPVLVVTNGTLTLPAGDLGQQPRAAMLRAGLPYVGLIKTHNLEMGGRFGPAQAKARNISEINIRFLSSLGVNYGTDLYGLQKIDDRLSDAISDRPAPVFSGIKRVKLEDSWSGLDDTEREKNIFIMQSLPLPAIVQSLDITYDTTDEGSPE